MRDHVIHYALIMAAGRGSRMMPLTSRIPKAMAPYGESTLIVKGIEKIKRYVPYVYVTVGYKGALLAEHVVSHGVTGLFDTSGQDNAWWIFNTLMSKLDEPVFVLTCDNVIELDFESLEADYFQLGSPACMVIPVRPVIGLEGDFIHKDDESLVRLIDRNISSNIYCSGIQVLNPKKITDLIVPSDNFYDVWNQLIELKQVYCSSIHPSSWFVADTIDQLENIPPGY